ncbi:hypothetical protein FXF51_36245 [Nonomuraea sp. PA05]|uniref:hypothetical protein n=1 Tax=Nonomuraea sp. PA05 TaxID=2604466 RepID=UPI0011D83842|nr:hypothetical protein [Nonomuraea sp. PA05]TYB58544.1 hypothetical protein FXF51_36245 [Nonomuraea sp. PA05]
MQAKPRDPGSDDGITPASGAKRRKARLAFKASAGLIGTTAAVLTILPFVIDDSPGIVITAPPTGPGAISTPCSVVRGTGTPANGMALVVAVRRAGPSPRLRTTRFYSVDTPATQGPWAVTVSLDAEDPDTAGLWYTISTLLVEAAWVEFLEKADSIADGPLTVAPAMPPHEGSIPSIDVQRGPGHGSC